VSAVRYAVLRYEWGTLAGSRWETQHHIVVPPSWPNWAVQRILDGRGEPPGIDQLRTSVVVDRSIAGFWAECSFGLSDLEFEIFPPDDEPVPTLQANQADGRGTVIEQARKQAQASGIDLGPFTGVVVWIYPPPCDGGASGESALFDQNGSHGFYCHEIGHALGMDHPYGPGGVYDDPYCVMGSGTWNRTLSPDPAYDDLPLPGGFWGGPCMPSAANMSKTPRWEQEFITRKMVESHDWGSPVEVELVALSEAQQGDKILVMTDIGHDFDTNPRRTWSESGTYYAEYRTTTGWDSNVEPAIVIHSRDIRPKPPVVKTDFLKQHPFHYGEVRPVYFEGRVARPFDAIYVSPNERFALEVLDISADRRVAKVRIGLPNQLRYQCDLHEESRQVTGEQVIETDTKTITPDQDPLLCQEGTYEYTRFDQAEEIAIRLHMTGFSPTSAQWRVSWADESVLSEGDTTLHVRLWGRFDEYLDLSLHDDLLFVRTRLVEPDSNGHIRPKRMNELQVTVVAEEVQSSGFVLERKAGLFVPLRTERTDLEQRYKDDVNFCYFLRSLRGVDKLTNQPPWFDPSDPLSVTRLWEELIVRGRLPREGW
jgi:hypothetical protein